MDLYININDIRNGNLRSYQRHEKEVGMVNKVVLKWDKDKTEITLIVEKFITEKETY